MDVLDCSRGMMMYSEPIQVNGLQSLEIVHSKDPFRLYYFVMMNATRLPLFVDRTVSNTRCHIVMPSCLESSSDKSTIQ